MVFVRESVWTWNIVTSGDIVTESGRLSRFWILESLSCTQSKVLHLINRSRPIEEKNQSLFNKIHTYLFTYVFFIVLLCRILATLGFGQSLPFCAEKRSSLLHESEGIFVALLGKQSFVVTKVRRVSCCREAIFRGNTIGDSAGDEASSGLRPDPATLRASSRGCNLYR